MRALKLLTAVWLTSLILCSTLLGIRALLLSVHAAP